MNSAIAPTHKHSHHGCCWASFRTLLVLSCTAAKLGLDETGPVQADQHQTEQRRQLCDASALALNLWSMVARLAHHAGFRSTRITESPRRNSFEMKRSLFTGLEAFFPFPVLGTSVHISLTFSRIMLQCLSNAFTRASSFRLFLQLISTCELLFTLVVSTERGPVRNSSSSFFSSSSTVGFFASAMAHSLPRPEATGWLRLSSRPVGDTVC
mmetsp:Transcript_1401/g.4173  ORF Transcript_1401/g.4173 Transcript_1401/m.4173 type:complete len:211 (+) Transcript_1401:171-803(+)